MKKQHAATLALIYKRPTSANVKWRDVESLFLALGAIIEEASGSRVTVILFGEVRVFHRPHPNPSTNKGAVVAVRNWLKDNGITP